MSIVSRVSLPGETAAAGADVTLSHLPKDEGPTLYGERGVELTPQAGRILRDSVVAEPQSTPADSPKDAAESLNAALERFAGLSPKALIIYGHLFRLSMVPDDLGVTTGVCWPSQEFLAGKIGLKNANGVGRYIRQLKQAGVLEVTDQGSRANLYRPLIPWDASKLTKRRWSNRGARTMNAQCTDNARTTNGQNQIPPLEIEKEKGETAANNAAAAAAFDSIFSSLVELGVPPNSHFEEHVKKDLALAKLVIAHCQERFAEKRPVQNKPGYVIACLRSPENYGFVQLDGRWSLPPISENAVKSNREEVAKPFDWDVEKRREEAQRRAFR